MRIIPFRPIHAPAIKWLYRQCFGGRVHISLVEKRFRNAIGFIAWDEDNLPAAYYGVFPVSAGLDVGKITWAIYSAAQSGWTMTRPDHRGKGLFMKLARLTYSACEEQNIRFVFGFPNQNSYPGFVRLGWQFTGYMHEFSFMGGLPIAEIRHGLTATKPTAERWNGQTRYRIINHLVIGDTDTVNPDFFTGLAKKHNCSKAIFSVSGNHDLYPRLLQQYNMLAPMMQHRRTLPIGFMPIDTTIDFSKFTFTTKDYDTYI